MPTQFSIHHRDNIDAEPRHSEYLANATKDCERELAEALIEALGQRGSIIVYTTFEQRASKLSEMNFPVSLVHYRRFLTVLWTSSPLSPITFIIRISRGASQLRKFFQRWFRICRMQTLKWHGETAIMWFARMAKGKVSARPSRLHASSFSITARWTPSQWCGCTKLSTNFPLERSGQGASNGGRR